MSNQLPTDIIENINKTSSMGQSSSGPDHFLILLIARAQKPQSLWRLIEASTQLTSHIKTENELVILTHTINMSTFNYQLASTKIAQYFTKIRHLNWHSDSYTVSHMWHIRNVQHEYSHALFYWWHVWTVFRKTGVDSPVKNSTKATVFSL